MSVARPLHTIPVVSGELPLLGSLPVLLTDDLRLRDRVIHQHPDLCRVHAGPVTVVLVANKDYCQDVLTRTEEFDKTPAVTITARPTFGTGILLIANGPHRARRRLIQPAFNHSRVDHYAGTVSTYAAEAVAHWRDGQVLDIGEELARITMRVIGKVMFDLDNLGADSALGQAVTATFEHMKIAFLLPLPVAWPLPHNLRLQRALKLLDGIIYDLITTRRAEGVDHGDLLSMLLAANADGERLSDHQIRDDAMAILVAGHETTAYSLAFALYLLATHPLVRQRIQHEVDTVLGTRPPTLADLANLPYTTQVFKETLRLYPAAHILPRQATRDTTIGAFAVKKGWFVVMDVWTMHRRPDYFPQPDHFDPDRFTPENEQRIPRGAYLPFGSGPRNCIGRQLAMLEGPLALATLVQQVTLDVALGTWLDLKFLLTIRPKHPLRMRVTRR